MQVLGVAVLAQAAAPAGGGPLGGLGSMGGLVPIVLMVAIFYFMLIRPQQRREKERRQAIESMRAGQRVLFAGGLIGTIIEARQHTFVIEVAKGVQVEAARGAVSRALKDGEAASIEEPRA